MKVRYTSADGSWTSVAYLEETEAINWYDRVYTGKDKNTGRPVSLILTDKGWRETEPRL